MFSTLTKKFRSYSDGFALSTPPDINELEFAVNISLSSLLSDLIVSVFLRILAASPLKRLTFSCA